MSPAKKKPVHVDVPATTPLNRKYRPQSFDSAELVGQEHVVRTLKNAIRSNRIASAYLFCGPRGTGKTSTARILAKAVNCLDPDPDKRPCNACSACVAINTGATPDVIEIDAASNRGIDDIRDLRDRVNYAPTQLKTKFYIIDEAHQITGAAANAFLKTLEEPPAHTKFILATTDPEELLPTIVSRCQRFDFRRHTREGIAKRLKSLAEREGIRLSDDALELVAELAHGSMRDPIGLLDQLASYRPASGVNETLSADDVRELVGITHSEIAIQILVAISESDPKSALQAINEAVTAGQDPRQLNRQVVSLIRDGLYLASGARTIVDQPGLTIASERLGLPGLLRVANAFADTDNAIRSAVIPQLPLEMSVLDAIVGPATKTQSTASDAIANEPNRPAAKDPAHSDNARVPQPGSTPVPTVEQNPQPVATEAPSTRLQDMVRSGMKQRSVQDSPVDNGSPIVPTNDVHGDNTVTPSMRAEELTIETLVEMWPHIRADIKSLDRRTEALLMEIDPVEISAEEIVLAASYDFHRNKVNEDERKAIVESVIGRRIGRSVRVHCVLRSEFSATTVPRQSEPVRTAPAAIDSERRAEPEQSEETPDEKMLGAVVRMFDGEIIADK